MNGIRSIIFQYSASMIPVGLGKLSPDPDPDLVGNSALNHQDEGEDNGCQSGVVYGPDSSKRDYRQELVYIRWYTGN